MGIGFGLGLGLGLEIGLGIGLGLRVCVRFVKLYYETSVRTERAPGLFHFFKAVAVLVLEANSPNAILPQVPK